MRTALSVVLLCLLAFLVPGVSAFTVSSVSFSPSGTLNPGDPVNISYTVYAASGVAFPSYDDLQFVTELSDPAWTYTIAVNGVKNIRPVTGGRVLTISGFELAYQNQDEVIVRYHLPEIPSGAAPGANTTLVRIQELDARGYAIPYSVCRDRSSDRAAHANTDPFVWHALGRLCPLRCNVYIDNAYKGLTPVRYQCDP